MRREQIISRQRRKYFMRRQKRFPKEILRKPTTEKIIPLPGMTTDLLQCAIVIGAGVFFDYTYHFLICGSGIIGEERQIQRCFCPPFFTYFHQVRRRIMPIWNPLISLALRDCLFSKTPLQSIFISSAGTFLSE